jgi:putative DNA primase/helicase
MSALLATYEYTDSCSEVIFEARKFYDARRGKRFEYWGQSPETGSWEPRKPPDADRYLYRLPALVGALRRGEPVALTEGEKDADTLTTLGIVASSHHGGATKFTEAQAEWFRGCTGHVFLLLDNDPPGAACVLHRLRLLVAVGLAPQQMTLLYSPYAKDVTDHVEAGHGLDELRPVENMRALRREARKFTPATRRRYGYDPAVAP